MSEQLIYQTINHLNQTIETHEEARCEARLKDNSPRVAYLDGKIHALEDLRNYISDEFNK